MEEGKVIEMQPKGAEEQGKQPERLSYEQLNNVAQQAHQQAEMWKQRAYEASAKMTRIDLILNCLNMNIQYIKEKCILFNAEAVESMTLELIGLLYPQENSVVKDDEITPTESVN